MNSVLTNTSAMTALQVLNSVNKGLNATQGRISTGLKVATADQNAAIFAIAGTMRADVAGYETIAEGVGFAESAVAVARSTSEAVAEFLTEIKTKIVQAQPGTVDRSVIQADIDELIGQIKNNIDAASFNGINYLLGTDAVSVLSSLNRSTSDGATYTVTSSSINFVEQNMVGGSALPTAVSYAAAGTRGTAVGEPAVTDIDVTIDATTAANNGTILFSVGGTALTTAVDLTAVDSLTEAATAIQTQIDADAATDTRWDTVTVVATADGLRITDTAGRTISGVTLTGIEGGTSTFEFTGTTTVDPGVIPGTAATQSITTYTFGNLDDLGTMLDGNQITSVTYTNADGLTQSFAFDTNPETGADLATDLETLLNDGSIADVDIDGDGSIYEADGTTEDTADEDPFTVTFSQGVLTVTDDAGRGVALNFQTQANSSLAALDGLDVTSTAGAKSALNSIELMLQSTFDTASALGSTQKRLSIQREFLSKLTDALETGIGTLVDADMTAESAKLQSLQVQQQLATQALSIANQQPQNLLALFR